MVAAAVPGAAVAAVVTVAQVALASAIVGVIGSGGVSGGSFALWCAGAAGRRRGGVGEEPGHPLHRGQAECGGGRAAHEVVDEAEGPCGARAGTRPRASIQGRWSDPAHGAHKVRTVR